MTRHPPEPPLFPYPPPSRSPAPRRAEAPPARPPRPEPLPRRSEQRLHLAEHQDPAGGERVRERLEQPLLQCPVEVDHHVAAHDEVVRRGGGRLAGEIGLADAHEALQRWGGGGRRVGPGKRGGGGWGGRPRAAPGGGASANVPNSRSCSARSK